MNLEEYATAVQAITRRGDKSIRRLVFDIFLRYFTGATTTLGWHGTASQITGNALFAP